MAKRIQARPNYRRNDLSAAYVKTILSYNRKTGVFHWKNRTDISPKGKRKTGKIAGFIHKDGYWRIKINDVSYLAHRLAWLYVTGRWPKHEIDHVKNNRSDNRWKKLREATDGETAKNAKKRKNKIGAFKGITRQKNGHWAARIRTNKILINLGTYSCPKKAHAAYCKAAKKLHGEFANFG